MRNAPGSDGKPACGHGLAGIDGEALCCELTGKGYGMLPVGLVTFGNCLIPFQVSPMCLQKSERSKDQGDDQATGKDGPLEPRRPICGAARCRDVLTLVGSRRGSRVGVAVGQPFLCVAQIRPAEQLTAFRFTRRPVLCADLQPGVFPGPVHISVQRLEQLRETGVEVGVILKENPVRLRYGIRDWLAVPSRSAQQGDDLLTGALGLGELLSARAGVQRVG